MKLYEVPRDTKVRSDDVLKGEPFNFHHIDGMYSYCTNNAGDVFHLAAWAEVEIVECPA